MDVDGPSSPPNPSLSLPPSSGPSIPLLSSSNGHVHQNGVNGRVNGRNGVDALAFDDIQQEQQMNGDQDAQVAARRRRGRTRGQIEGDIPLVRDALGEQITETFQRFLET